MSLPERRNSLRYPGFDYSQPAGIFVTCATYNRQPIFGQMHRGNLIPTPAATSLGDRWRTIPARFVGVEVDAFTVMPDHFHGILWFGTSIERNTVGCGDVVRWLKSAVVKDYGIGVNHAGWSRYDTHLWQRGYYDHIIRGEKDLVAIRDYIGANVARWIENNK